MGAIGEEELVQWERMQHGEEGPTVRAAAGDGDGGERIRVWVRLRPLNDKEIARNEVSDWECIDDRTIMFRNSLPERSMFPDPPRAYTFDRVFRSECTTKKVYEEVAKHVVLSVVSGINSTIFAYGQTSSGKTFTMNGITEYSVADIYDYIERHEERAFVLKFSAMEIYNEAIRDLLSTDGTQLRVLDDPERGTIVERLTEEVLRDSDHLKELLSICEAQRQIGETSLNETSSRSHQILRLTIESSAREFLGKENSRTLAASVNFVDLAGSERASQMLSSGTRLKEGCHINRSLLTLGTVIRKLSKGGNMHIPYRDSKLTRILQPSLGGNARTAIICTMCPSRSHLEQSKNTLLFASCAKEVATHAQVNVVMSDKALVKHLQKELARLESELRSPHTTVSSRYEALLRAKNAQIQKMEKEIKELTQERDLAQSRLQAILGVVGDEQASRSLAETSDPLFYRVNGFEDEPSMSESSSMADCSLHSGVETISKSHFARRDKMFSNKQKESGEASCQLSDDNLRFANSGLQQSGKKNWFKNNSYESFKDVECVEVEESRQSEWEHSNSNRNVFHEQNEELPVLTETVDATEAADSEPCENVLADRELTQSDADTMYGALERQLQDVEKTINDLGKPHKDEPSLWPLSQLHTSCQASHSTRSYSPGYKESDSNMNTPPRRSEISSHPKSVRRRPRMLNYETDVGTLPRADSQSSELSNAGEFLKGETNKGVSEENFTSIQSFVAGLKEMAQLQYEKQLSDDQDTECETNLERKDVGLDPLQTHSESLSHWPIKFQRQQREIIMLWHECNVSLVHRTYFFLLFKGDPTDSIYTEVELRRLSFLKATLFDGNCIKQEGHVITMASSMRALRKEREMLSREMQKRLTAEEREKLYEQWSIGLNSKQRKLQLACSLWTGTSDMDHVRESAAVVAKLVGLSEQGQVLKEMFGLSFSPQTTRRRSFSWKNSMSSLL